MKPRRRGFSLVESLIALLVTAFGLLSIAGVSLKLSHGEARTRLRGEAVRLAQDKLEQLRALAAAGVMLPPSARVGSDAPAGAATPFRRQWRFLDDPATAAPRVLVEVHWADSLSGHEQPASVSIGSVIARQAPADSGALGLHADDATLKRPLNRHPSIPVGAVDLGQGFSAWTLAPRLALVLDNRSGLVVRQCAQPLVDAAAAATCASFTGRLVGGYVSLSGAAAWPAALTMTVDGDATAACTLARVDDALSRYLGYHCLVADTVRPPTAAPERVRLQWAAAGPGPQRPVVCRLPESGGVADPEQNFVIAPAGPCPSVDGVQTHAQAD